MMLCVSLDPGLGPLGLVHAPTEASLSPSLILLLGPNLLELSTTSGR